MGSVEGPRSFTMLCLWAVGFEMVLVKTLFLIALGSGTKVDVHTMYGHRIYEVGGLPFMDNGYSYLDKRDY